MSPAEHPDVTLIAPYPRAGVRHGGSSGVASYTANLATALAGEGARVSVVAPRLGGEPEVTYDGAVRVERRFETGALALPRAMAAAVRTRAPVVHLQHELFLYGGPAAVPGLVPALARRRGRARRLVTMHQVVDPGRIDGGFTRVHRVGVPVPVARAAIAGVQETVRRLADRVVVHEPAFASVVSGAAVVPHGVEASVDAPTRDAARARLGLPQHAFVPLCFGFLAPYKGLELVGDAALQASDRVVPVIAGGEHPRLAAAGEGYAAQLHRRYGERVRFTGYVDDVNLPAWFAAADVVLLPYPKPHASSGVLALALAHRRPALLSPQLAATVDAPASLVLPTSAGELAALLERLAADGQGLADRAAATGAMGHDRSWPAVARRHLSLYAEVGA